MKEYLQKAREQLPWLKLNGGPANLLLCKISLEIILQTVGPIFLFSRLKKLNSTKIIDRYGFLVISTVALNTAVRDGEK